MEQIKKCTKCGTEKPYTTEYFKYKNKKKGKLSSQCKECDKKYREENKELIQYHRDKNKEYMRGYWSRYYKENKEKLLEDRKARMKAKESVEYAKVCAICGKEFITIYPHQKVCSKACQPEYINISARKYRESNRQKLRDRQKEYYQKNKDAIRVRWESWYVINKDKCIENSKEWKKNNKDKVRKSKKIRRHKIRALKKDNGGSYTAKQWKETLEYFDYKCAYSGESVANDCHIDHIIPISKGGTSYIWNLVPSLSRVNISKSNKDMEKWYKTTPYFSEDRLNKIYEYIEYMKNKYKDNEKTG